LQYMVLLDKTILAAATPAEADVAIAVLVALALGFSVILFLLRGKIKAAFSFIAGKLASLRKKEVVEEEKKVALPEEKERELITRITELEEAYRQATERAKQAEEMYDELKAESEEVKRKKEEVDKELEKHKKEFEELTKETRKLVKWVAQRFKRGQYVPTIGWTKRGNPTVLKFTCAIAQIDGGWRALLVDSLTAHPDTGEWYPPLGKPAPNFIFRDQDGFEPDNPEHTVLFDVNFRDWYEDLILTREDPKAKPVAFMLGVDEDGQPNHRLEYGAPIDIRQLRQQNRALKVENARLRYRMSKVEEEMWRTKYDFEREKDLREHYERINKELKAALAMRDEIIELQVDESEIMRAAVRSRERREYAWRRRLRQTEDEYYDEVIEPRIRGIPGYQYFQQLGRERQQQMLAKLYPIALTESKMYGIETRGKDMYDVVTEWLRQKYEKEGKDISAVLDEYGLKEDVGEILRGGFA